jgi:hypothetical protein
MTTLMISGHDEKKSGGIITGKVRLPAVLSDVYVGYLSFSSAGDYI